jgi:hypothetical protein
VKDDKRHSKFHSGDHSINVDDLWKAWQESEGIHVIRNKIVYITGQ